jgi:hypothetical protein
VHCRTTNGLSILARRLFAPAGGAANHKAPTRGVRRAHQAFRRSLRLEVPPADDTPSFRGEIFDAHTGTKLAGIMRGADRTKGQFRQTLLGFRSPIGKMRDKRRFARSGTSTGG